MSTDSFFLLLTITCAPNSARPYAIAFPIPFDAPVTIATFLVRSNFSLIILNNLLITDKLNYQLKSQIVR